MYIGKLACLEFLSQEKKGSCNITEQVLDIDIKEKPRAESKFLVSPFEARAGKKLFDLCSKSAVENKPRLHPFRTCTRHN